MSSNKRSPHVSVRVRTHAPRGGQTVASLAAGNNGVPPRPSHDSQHNLSTRRHTTIQTVSRSRHGRRRNTGVLPLDERVKMWERQPAETYEAYAKFCTFRDLDPSDRTYPNVAQKLGLNSTNLRETGTAYRWVERAAAWDMHIDRARIAATETYQIEMAARHAELAQNMLGKLAVRLEKVNLAQLGPKEIASWLEVGVKVERLSRGLRTGDPDGSPGSITNNTTNNILALSDQDLIQMLSREGVRRGKEIKNITHKAKKLPSNTDSEE